MAEPITSRTYSAAHFCLELGNKEMVGFFRSCEGGGITTEVITTRAGRSHAQWRQLARPKYADLKLQVGMSMSKVFYSWIEAFFSGKVVRKSGAIVAGDFHYKERARREFSEALIAAIDFPKLDATDNNACNMGISLTPESIRFVEGTGKNLEPFIGKMEQKHWKNSNFSMILHGFEAACRRITKIDGFQIKQQILEYPAGNLKDALRVPGMLEFPNLSFYVPESDAQPFMDHFTKYVINGEAQAAARHDGAINLLDHNGKELCTITLKGCDISKVEPDKSDASSQDIKQVKIEIAVESMKFDYVAA